MKFTVNREKLQKALQRVGSIIGSRSMLPVLGNVLIQAEEGFIRLTTTDLEIRISTRVDAVVEEAGSTTAPARKLTSLVGCFVGSDVVFDVDEKDHIKLRCATSHFTLLGLPAADFPPEAEFEARRGIRMKESDFKRMVGAISYAVSADDSRKVLTGVLLNVRDSQVTLVATDGKPVAVARHLPYRQARIGNFDARGHGCTAPVNGVKPVGVHVIYQARAATDTRHHHYLVRRYAELCHCLVQLAEYGMVATTGTPTHGLVAFVITLRICFCLFHFCQSSMILITPSVISCTRNGCPSTLLMRRMAVAGNCDCR